MFRYHTCAAALLALSLSACSDGSSPSSSEKLLAANDFEQLAGWIGDNPAGATLTTDKAHSGKYSVVVKPGSDYGLGYGNVLSKLSGTRPAKIAVSAWVLVPNKDAGAVLVTEIKDPATNKTLLWAGLDCGKQVKKFNEWQKVEKTIDIPAEATAASRIQIYPWRGGGGQPVYVDDVEVRLVNP